MGGESETLDLGKGKAYGSLSKALGGKENARFAIGGLPVICLCILVVELCERLAFYTFTGTQEFFLEKNGYSLAQAGGINAAMSTLCMAWALLAGWFADVVLGRFHTIMLFGIIYAGGAAVATVGAWPANGSVHTYLFGIMVLVPLGTAGIKANISNFGADQYDERDPVQKAEQEKFFQWFYMAINMGSAIAYGYLTTMGSNGGLGVPQKYGYFAVYAISSVAMLVAVALFCSGRQYYRMVPVMSRSALGGVIKYVTAAARRGGDPSAYCMIVGTNLLAASIVMSVSQALMPNASFAKAFTYGAFFCALAGVTAVVVPCLNPRWIGNEPLQSEAVCPEDVQVFLRMLPTLIFGNISFNALYNSMQYWYQQQACQMDLRMPGGGNSQLSGSFFMIADCLGIVIATPLALGLLNPAVERVFPGMFRTGAKYGLGVFFGAASVIVAGALEVSRRSADVLTQTSNCAPDGVHMSNMSAFWMFVPFFLMGVGEIYTNPVLMHFAYTNSPPSMRTLATVLGLLIGSVSNALFTVQISALSYYVQNDLNMGHLEYGYGMNVLLGLMVFGLFVMALQSFEKSRAVTP